MSDHTDLTPEITARFAKLIADGNYFETACGVIGIAQSTGYLWLQKGREGLDASGPDPDAYRTFSEAVTQAEAEAEVNAVAELRRAAQPHDFETDAKGSPYAVVIEHDDKGRQVTKLPGDPRMSIEFLQRRYRKRWSKTEGREHTGEVGVKYSWWDGIEEAQADDETQQRPDES